MTINDLIRKVRQQLNGETLRYNALTEQLNTIRQAERVDTARENELVRERSHVEALLNTLNARVEDLEREAAADRAIEQLQSTPAPAGARSGGTATFYGTGTARGQKGFLNLRAAAEGVRGSGENIRALVASGSTVAPASILEASPVGMGKPATSLLDVLPARVVETGAYSYLRQTARTNLAAPVAPGAVKPESVMTLTRIDGALQVVAHLSEPVAEQWLSDVATLQQFIEEELGAGVNSALEDQILNGNGTAPELDGLVTTATGTQAYATSPLVTIRTGLAQFEAAGLAPAFIVLASADWLAIETATLTAGNYVLGQGSVGAPLDAIKRTCWGVPVVVSSAHAAGTAVLVSAGAADLVVDGMVNFKWGTIDDDFQRNQVRARAELRAQVEVYRPHGVIVADLTSGA